MVARWSQCLQKNVTILKSTSLVVIATMASLCLGEIFTSSDKILNLVERESTLLDALQMHIHAEYDNLKALSGFLSERSKAVRLASPEELRTKAEHPNGAFRLIKLYTRDWRNIRMANPLFDKDIVDLSPSLPSDEDFQGACSALVRLQRVYRLRVADMYSGNYSGYMGPPLQPVDTYEIGRQAFIDGFLQESKDWLQLAVEELERQDSARGSNRYSVSVRGQAYGLLGRAYNFMNDTKMAKEMYDIGNRLDSRSADVQQLQTELTNQLTAGEFGSGEEEWDQRLSELCRRDKHHTVEKLTPEHVCRYKTGFFTLPYVQYKEEILSFSPFVSLFHDIISEFEIESLTTFVKGQMFRGLVGTGVNATTTYIRTSDLGWIYDDETEVANTVAQRVKKITGLEVDQRLPDGPSSSEAFQIVNYGLGGHYDVHMDPFDDSVKAEDLLEDSGERLATFLIYMSDVEKGGNTVFVRSKISVAPKKGMALFWYNFDPKMDKDFNTYHAGCPVLIGHKWIANKWLWTYGNSFRRPCGPTPNSTQRDIEPLMYARQQNC